MAISGEVGRGNVGVQECEAQLFCVKINTDACTVQGTQEIFCNSWNWSVTLKIYIQIVLRNKRKKKTI